MTEMNLSGPSLIYAHRGANREAAENTRSAFDRALRHAIDGIETDVQLSRDEVAVLWHDRFLGKTGLPDRHIDDFDYSELRAMDFARHFAPDVAHETIMSLQQFIDLYRRRCRLLIEIKNREWESTARHRIKVRQTLSMAGADVTDDIMVSSFNLDSLVYAHQCQPQFPLMYNLETDQTPADINHVLSAQPWLHGLCLPITTLDTALARMLRGDGKMIAVYTCNSDDEINKALDLAVDILISDLPQRALDLRAARYPGPNVASATVTSSGPSHQ